MGPFPIELQIENRAVSLQPRGARDGDLCPTYGGSTKKEAILKDNLLNNGARDGDLCPTYGGSTKKEAILKDNLLNNGARDGTRTHDLLITNGESTSL